LTVDIDRVIVDIDRSGPFSAQRCAMPDANVHELRLVLTVEDLDSSVRIYRDLLGMREVPAVSSPGGRVVILEAGRATLELADAAHAAYIDEVEVGHRCAGQVRIALGVVAVTEQSQRLENAGLVVVAPPTMTPFGSTNSRFELPDGLQLTLVG
jgi:lactoylglutathione lyase